MVRRRASQVVRRIKQCAQDGLLLFSDHARREMNDDGFNEADVSSAIRLGHLTEMEKFFRRLIVYDGPQSNLDVLKTNAANPFASPEERIIATQWADKFRLKDLGCVTAQFDKDTSFHGDKGFLRLVDRVAHHTFRQLRKANPQPEFFDALKAAGQTAREPLDITEHVISRDPKLVEEWERKTGQKPQE